ncbi:cyclin-u1-1 [Phtheirospermum japonicum]|uniref:Cyclin n=1 Tax=Phtheirospermum japonicum TaxID=374723 RepID=A0A830D6L7_9LAMI|nr:cyclin-u1-1 [Phtheirospermum japonicum]
MLTGGAEQLHQPRLPEPSQHDPSTTPRVLTILSHVLEKLVTRNDDLLRQAGGGSAGKTLSAFDGVRAPAISLEKYVERIYKYTGCSPSCFVVGFVYIDRLVHKYPDSLLVPLNVHRLVVTSVMVASKILDDVHYNNAFYARVGGVSNAELNRLELELLFLLDFGVCVSSRVFETYCQHLEKEILLSNGVAIDRPTAIINSIDDVTEISVEDNTQSSSPPTPLG